jgi:hypothetical protein
MKINKSDPYESCFDGNYDGMGNVTDNEDNEPIGNGHPVIDKQYQTNSNLIYKIGFGLCAAYLLANLVFGGIMLYSIGANSGKKIREENVTGNSKLEKFVEINGEKFYSEIDGKKIESLIK